jgi:hypothetical protein
MKKQRDVEPSFYITVPADLSLYAMVDSGTGQVVHAFAEDDPDAPEGAEPQVMEFARDFVVRMLLNDPAWSSELQRLYLAMDLRGAFRGKRPGDVVRVSKAAHEALCEVVKKPSKGYNGAVAIHFGEWFEAILDAPNTAPEKVKTANGEAKASAEA